MNLKTATILLPLALLSLAGMPAHARPASVPGTPRVAINPQPLPPLHVDSAPRVAINPQPLPPRNPDPELRKAASRPYIGETEKSQR